MSNNKESEAIDGRRRFIWRRQTRAGRRARDEAPTSPITAPAVWPSPGANSSRCSPSHGDVQRDCTNPARIGDDLKRPRSLSSSQVGAKEGPFLSQLDDSRRGGRHSSTTCHTAKFQLCTLGMGEDMNWIKTMTRHETRCVSWYDGAQRDCASSFFPLARRNADFVASASRRTTTHQQPTFVASLFNVGHASSRAPVHSCPVVSRASGRWRALQSPDGAR
ncbi:hypothetical protein V8C44DRAFT_219540 [Trichoderma aethiopicum]